MLTLLSFVVTLGILIAVHEYGHYRVAVACGIKVLKFSIGFGKPIYTWRLKGKSTEFSIGMLPLGGYVKMLDEREAPVDAAERHLAFNNQPLKYRAATVAAGPAANLLLAVLLYSIVNWGGMQEPKAVLASPVVGSLAERSGLRGHELVEQAAFDGDELESVRSFEDLRWRLTRGALDARDLTLLVTEAGASERTVTLPLSQLGSPEADAALFRKIGLLGPWTAWLVALRPGRDCGLETGWSASATPPSSTDNSFVKSSVILRAQQRRARRLLLRRIGESFAPASPCSFRLRPISSKRALLL